MALLNFATSYNDVADKLKLAQSETGDYIKLYFTKDGHIISHGVDYIPWGTGIIPINKLPVDNTVADNKHLWDSATVQDKINQSFAANDAMRFKGTIGLTSVNNYTINGVASEFPSKTATVGDTYRVVTAGNYAGIKCEVGDLLICIKADPTGTTTAWTVAQTNINGQVYHTINGVQKGFYSNDTDTFSIFAPTTAGALGQVLTSAGGNSAPVWKNQSEIIAGGLTDAAKKALFTVLTYTNDVLTVTIGGTTKTATIRGRRAVNVNSTEVLSTSDSTALKFINGNGISFNWDNENKNLSVNANVGFTTDAVSRNYAVKTDTKQQLYVNVPWTNTTYGIVSNKADGLAPKVINTNTTLINSAFYLLASSNGTATPSWYKLPASAFANTWRDIKIKGTSIGSNALNLLEGSHITLSNSNGTVTISSTWRDIKIGNVSIGNKALNIDASGDIYVARTETDNTVTIDFGISWYNLDTGQYETI